MPNYDPVELQYINDTFVYAVQELLPADYNGLSRWLQIAFKISTLRNIDAWFGRASFERKFISSRTPAAQKPYRIVFAKAFCHLIPTNQPVVCKDFHLDPEGEELGRDKFEEYFDDNYVIQNLVTIDIDSNKITLCYKKYPDDDYDSSEPFDMNNPAFDEFRSGEEEE